MIDQAKENLNVEVGAGSALNKIIKDFEIKKSTLSDKEISEATQKAADLAKIEQENFENKKTDEQINAQQNQKLQKTTWKTWMERAKDHSDNIANMDRAIAGWNITQDLQKPEKWPAKRLQNISKWILWSNNLK